LHLGFKNLVISNESLGMKQIGVIGLGAMGTGMAVSLARAGHKPIVFDVRKEQISKLVDQGAQAANSASHLASQCDVIVCVVINAQQTEDVLFGSGAVANAMKAGSVFVMCSTVAPQFAQGLEQRLNAMHLHFLDAPISGGAAKAASGQMTMMTAGKPECYALCEAYLSVMAAKVYKLGDCAGNGSKVKIINQLLAGVHIAAAAEAMALGLREGVQADQLYEVITNSAGNSWMFENRMPHVLNADYTPLSAVDIFVKDLGLVLDTARASKFPLPLASTAHQMFMQASSAGYGREDDSAVIKIFPGIELPGKK
jgi:L-threonate 2-dehydrogenase